MLVVEDDRYVAGLVEMESEHRGSEVCCVYDGPTGLAAAQKFDPAVIVLVTMLPGLDGVGVLKRLRSGGSRAPVVMLTARDVPISDTGIDIPEDQLSLVFERFHRAHRTRRPNGAGLGLAIACQIAETHRGAIEAPSRPGEGSSFVMRLPRKGTVEG